MGYPITPQPISPIYNNGIYSGNHAGLGVLAEQAQLTSTNSSFLNPGLNQRNNTGPMIIMALMSALPAIISAFTSICQAKNNNNSESNQHLTEKNPRQNDFKQYDDNAFNPGEMDSSELT
jgi:hypothetical protein